MNCYKCESNNIVKNGHTEDGRQKYICKTCKSILTEDATHFFTEQEKTKLKSFVKQKLSVKDMATILNRTEKSIYAILERLNLHRSLNK